MTIADEKIKQIRWTSRVKACTRITNIIRINIYVELDYRFGTFAERSVKGLGDFG